jgi:S1-C subfamily serine protease
LEGEFRLNGEEVTKAFEPLRLILQQSCAVIYDGYKSGAFGVVVSPDGYIVTEASELGEIKDLRVRIDQKEYRDVQVLASTAEWDVALLRVEAENLVPIDWSEGAEPEIGTWVAANGPTSRLRRRVRVGIISAHAREIGAGRAPVVLGIELKQDEDVLSIRRVQEKSGAEEAGLKKDDVILEADGQKVSKMEDLQEVLKKKGPGDILKVQVGRDGEEKEYDVELRAREDIFEEKKTRNDAMSGRTSKRRTNFQRVLQTDLPFSERSTGGPLLNLDGRCVGMNIARANRSESFAIPAEEMQKIISDLFSQAK